MKQSWIKIFAVAAMVLLAVIGCVAMGIPEGMLMLALPFTLAGKGLRMLSLSGSIGNLAALLLYGFLCLLPVLLKLRSKWKKQDLLLIVSSAALFYTLYYMINPAYRPVILQNDAGTLALAGAVYSLLLSWLVLKLMGACAGERTEALYGALRVFLFLCVAEFAIGIVVGFGDFLTCVKEVKAANTMPGLNLLPTHVFAFLSFAVTALEYGLDIWVLYLAGKLLGQLQVNAYSEGCYVASRKLAAWCRKSLAVFCLSTAVLNVGQILFASRLHNLAVGFRLPVVSLALAFALLALTRLLHQGKALKEDNELFI